MPRCDLARAEEYVLDRPSPAGSSNSSTSSASNSSHRLHRMSHRTCMLCAWQVHSVHAAARAQYVHVQSREVGREAHRSSCNSAALSGARLVHTACGTRKVLGFASGIASSRRPSSSPLNAMTAPACDGKGEC